MKPFPFLKSRIGCSDSLGPKLGGGELCCSYNMDKGFNTFNGSGLSIGSSIITYFLIVEGIERPSHPEDLFLFIPLEESLLEIGGVPFWKLLPEEETLPCSRDKSWATVNSIVSTKQERGGVIIIR